MTEEAVDVSTQMLNEHAACCKIIETLADHRLTIDAGMDAIAMTIVIMMRTVEMKPEDAHHLADELARIIKANYHLSVEPMQ